MIDGSCFIIHGKKDIIIRKEENGFITHDPYELAFYALNDFAAEILYLVYLEKNLVAVEEYFKNKYSIEKDETNALLREFFDELPLTKAISANLIQLNLI